MLRRSRKLRNGSIDVVAEISDAATQAAIAGSRGVDRGRVRPASQSRQKRIAQSASATFVPGFESGEAMINAATA